MDKDELSKINERLENIEEQIDMLFREFKLRTPDDDKWSTNLYFSTYFTAQQIKEVGVLFMKAACDLPDNPGFELDDNYEFDVTKLRERFEAFRLRHLPYSEYFSLKEIAKGFIVEDVFVELSKQILDDIEKNPEKHIPKFEDDLENDA
jgi:hypothetical protein